MMVRSRIAWVLLIAGIVACVAIAYGASRQAAYSWDQVVSYSSPYVAEPLASDDRPAPPAPLARRVVLVIVDGMRDDVTRFAMPGVDRLRGYGADVVLETPQPSLSYPNWTTILTGAPQTLTGVTTNWWEGRVPVPSLVDEALDSTRSVAVVGPSDFAELYGVEDGPMVSLREWPEGGYLSATLIDDALRIAKAYDPELMIVHLPDLDEAGHDFGGTSDEYRGVAARIDTDLSRLIAAVQSEGTAFVIVSDHGHIDAGGHGGWESEVVRVPLIVSGAGARTGQQTTGSLDQVAATVAVLAGMSPPAFSSGQSLRAAVVTDSASVFAAEDAQQLAVLDRVASVVGGEGLSPDQLADPVRARDGVQALRDRRIASERDGRVRAALLVVAAALLVFGAVVLASWRAFVATIAGAAAYYAVYNVLFFSVHRYRWSLSAFNTEDYLQTFFNVRMAETVAAGLVGVAVAAAIYPLLRKAPKGPRETAYLAGWLSLAPSTALVIMATLAMQVAWFLWAYGASVDWTLPDFKWAFKYDLDLVQMTALGAVAVLGMLVSYVVGRYHPRVPR